MDRDTRAEHSVRLQVMNLWVVASLSPVLFIVTGLPGVLPGLADRRPWVTLIGGGVLLLGLRLVSRFGAVREASPNRIVATGVLGDTDVDPHKAIGAMVLGRVALAGDAEWIAVILRPEAGLRLLVILGDAHGNRAAASLLKAGRRVVGARLVEGRIETRRSRQDASANDFFSRN